MATLTVGTAALAARSQWRSQGIKIVRFSGAGVTISELVAAVSEQYVVVIGGRVTASGACGLDLSSDSTVIDQIEFVVTDTKRLPAGLETDEGEALKITNADGATIRGWLAYAQIPAGRPIAILTVT